MVVPAEPADCSYTISIFDPANVLAEIARPS